MNGTRLAVLVGRDSLPRFSRAVAPQWILLAFAVVQADAVTDWDLLKASIAALPPKIQVLLAGALAAGWASSVAPALFQSLRADRDRWRWRLPHSGAALALGLAPVWLMSVAPLVFAGWLFSHPLALPAAAVFPALALASRRRLRAVLGMAAGFGIVGAAQVAPIGLPVLLIAGHLASREVVQSPPPASGAPAHASIRPRGPLQSLWLRDLRALVRLERGAVITALFVSAPAYAVQSAAVTNFPLTGESATQGGLLVLTLASTAAAGTVLALPQLLGDNLDPRRAPLSPALRSAMLASIGAALAVPSLIAVLWGGSGGAGRLVVQVLAIVTGAAWFSVGLGRRTPADRGSFIWWILMLGGLSLAPMPWSLVAAIALTGLAWFGTTQTLARARRHP